MKNRTTPLRLPSRFGTILLISPLEGSSGCGGKSSRFYILGMVFHDQSHDISRIVTDLERSESELGLEGHCFHAGPLIRKEKGYEIMSRRFRGRILSRMMAFADRIDFKYHCLSVDKKFIDNVGQIVEHLRHSLQAFIDAHRAMLTAIDKVKV